jgi:pyruvate carboxylase
LFERDCTVQRRHQKVVERAPAPYLSEAERAAICGSALKLVRVADYCNAGTVEFLQDADSGEFYFIEVNPRIQVEHTVTECVTGIDIVKAQIHVAEGAAIGTDESGVPHQDDIRLFGHAIQCRVTTENPDANFAPDHGRLETYRSASGFGVRLDAGTAFAGALITPHYDSLLVKVTAWDRNPDGARARMDRALREFRIRGVATNLRFLEAVINHPLFRTAEYTTRFIDETPELFAAPPRRDRATRLLAFIGETIVNGNSEAIGHTRPARAAPRPPEATGRIPPGTRDRLEKLGPEGFARWMKDETRALITDTTLRDAHQSLLATRVRTHDLIAVAPAYARMLPELFSIECWGGATFDVAMRFLKESPWHRLEVLRERIPNVLFQMLLRASNAVGYSNYPDNAVEFFVREAADAGIDVFRVFDSLNWAENMKVAIDAVLETGKLCEAAICYTGDVMDPDRSKYDLDYYLDLAREMKAAGTHILGIKDMAGVCRPEAARLLVRAMREETGLPIHFHTHDTSGAGAASVLAAIEAGCDAVDVALDAMSGLTSQPSLGSVVAALQHTPRDTGLDMAAIRALSGYWEGVRRLYAPFESDLRWGASEVYMHEMPGGQYTNLRQQAAALGLSARWPEVARAYADVNRMFGDVIKVTPTSKVVGDLALMMVSQNLTAEDIEAPDTPISFPDSVISFFHGDVGQPPGGFPEALQRKVLAGKAPLTERPGKSLAPVDLKAARRDVAKQLHRQRVSDREVASYLMYPQVYADFVVHRRNFGDVSVLPTSTFFYGMEPGEEITASIERGKTLVVRFLALGDVDARGERAVFFELNGQPRTIMVPDRNATPSGPVRAKADEGNPGHVGAPMPSTVVAVGVEPGKRVAVGDALVTLEAMKMETTVRAERDGIIGEVLARVGDALDTGDLLVVIRDGD